MIRWLYSAGSARIVELQLNSSMTPGFMDGHTGQSATSANRAEHGSDAIKARTEPSVESPTKNCGD